MSGDIDPTPEAGELAALREALDELSKQAAVLRTGDVNAAHQAIGIDIAVHDIRAALAAANPSPEAPNVADLHREAVWDERGYHPGYGKGVCEFDGQPWPCKHWRAALAAAKPSPDVEVLREALEREHDACVESVGHSLACPRGRPAALAADKPSPTEEGGTHATPDRDPDPPG